MSKSSDAPSQTPSVGFNRTTNIDKAAYVLKGIVDGVNVDENLVDAEILYLDAWMRSQNSLGLQVVAFDLYQAVNRVLEDQNVTHDERDDLNQLIQNIVEFDDENRTPDDESSTNEFLSMLKAICADGIIFQPEITRVEAWITANRDISKAFPIKPVYYQVRDAVKDNIEQTTYLDGKDFCDDVDHFSLDGKVICFAGDFVCGTTKWCQHEAEQRGARVQTRVTADVDVLVIGNIDSQDWQAHDFGEKIERAISLRAESGAPTIISEDQWTSLLNNTDQLYIDPILALV